MVKTTDLRRSSVPIQYTDDTTYPDRFGPAPGPTFFQVRKIATRSVWDKFTPIDPYDNALALLS